ncbi:MAG: hypothetical protein V4726_16755 [Verrucomicrobiota bacterium]
MATGLTNKIAGQIGEYLTCAELGRRGLIATTFTGNVPEYDLIVCDDSLRTIPIQVKTSRSDNWPSNASLWLDIDIDELQKKQINRGIRKIDHPSLIYVCVALGEKRSGDRFFICLKSDIQKICIDSYTRWMDPKNWMRPRNHKSFDNRYTISDLSSFEDNWSLVFDCLNQISNNNLGATLLRSVPHL